MRKVRTMCSYKTATKTRIVLLPIILELACYFFTLPCHSNTDTLLQGQQLRDWDHLTSSNGVFSLRFFSPGSGMVRYLAVFYHYAQTEDLHDGKVVWVADRDNPIPDTSGTLAIDVNGNLQISYSGGTSVVFFNPVPGKTKASATLLDTGNLVITELNVNGSVKRILWQSFDYPTNVLLPGMKLGFNFKLGRKWSLTSWRSDISPASGSFTLVGNPNDTRQLVLQHRGNLSWTSGPLRNGAFANMRAETPVRFDYVSKEGEKYFIHSGNMSSAAPVLILTPDGYLQDSHESVLVRCDPNIKYRGCVDYDYEMPQCRRYGSAFEPLPCYVNGDGYRFDESHNLSLYDCQKICWTNCSCTAYAATNEDRTGCEIFVQTPLPSRGEGIGSRGYYKFYSYDAESEKKMTKKKTWSWLIIGVEAIVILLLCCFLARRKFRVKGRANAHKKMLPSELRNNAVTTPTKHSKVNDRDKDMKTNHELHSFSLQTIAVATNNFSTTNKLGEGGFGPVYKGKLSDGQEVAVKKLSQSSRQGITEFKNEIELIARQQHSNLVSLLGCCIEGGENMLIYEYMPNKSLDLFLFGTDPSNNPRKKKSLKWTDRFNIIEGIAQGLLYLHQYSRLTVIHRDLKASNILLDKHLNPKISDFGAAKLFGINEAEANTNRIVGTYGYMPPEYALKGIVSLKTDVFSFGVLLLEIVSGKKNNSCYDLQHPVNLIGQAWQLWAEGRGLEFMDPVLEDSCSPSEVMRCIHVGLLCVQGRATERPYMSDVVYMLKNQNTQLPAPKQPVYFTGCNEGEVTQGEGPANRSVDMLPITDVEAR